MSTERHTTNGEDRCEYVIRNSSFHSLYVRGQHNAFGRWLCLTWRLLLLLAKEISEKAIVPLPVVSRIGILPAASTHSFSHRAFHPHGYHHHLDMALLKCEEALDIY